MKDYFDNELIDNGDHIVFMVYTNKHVGFDVEIKVVGNVLTVSSPKNDDTLGFKDEIKISNLRMKYNLDRAQAVVDREYISVCIPKKSANVNQVVLIEPTYF